MDSITLEKLEFGRVCEILAGFCRSSLGADLARGIRPSGDLKTIGAWLAETTEMVETLAAAGLPPIGGVADIRDALERATPGGQATGDDFAAIAATLHGCAEVRSWSTAKADTAPLLAAIGERLGEFQIEIDAIDRVVDGRGEVRDSASKRLASIRTELAACHQQIRQIVYGFVRRSEIAQHLQSTNVQMHGDRFVLPLKAEHRGRLPGVVHRSSHSGATLFVEPEECVQLNNRIVRLHEKQHDEIARLLNELAIKVHRRDHDIRDSLRLLARIDLISAKAQYSYQFEMACPTVSPDAPIQFHGARHPLLIEQAHRARSEGLPPEQVHPVVPIDVRLGADFNLLIITGSNTGGKTVALKTVGLMVLMAHSGMHLPTRGGAAIRLLDDVLLDVGDEQSLQQSLSTFGGHLMRIKHILARAGAKSLVLLDELGSGTDPEEGGAFGQAILDELRDAGCLGMVTTHLGLLKAYAYTHDGVDNASVEFDTQSLRPTYKLLIGAPGESHALVVAAHYGLPKRLIERAKHHLPRAGRQLRQAIRATAASRQASEEARVAAHDAKLAADEHRQAYQSKLADLEQVTGQFTDWLVSLPALRPGDEVYVRRFGKNGRLQRLQLSKQIALVDVDGLAVEVPLADLMPELGPAGAAEQITTLRRQIADQSKAAEADRAEAERLRTEARKRLADIEQRRQFVDAWLEAIGKLAIGDEVTFERDPGRGVLRAIDLQGGTMTVEIASAGDADAKRLTLRIQELLPEHGAFAKHPAAKPRPRPKRGEAKSDRPIVRRTSGSKRSKANRRVLLAAKPGTEVYVTPFGKRARLLRIDADKDIATVLSGAFEIQVPIADLEPIDSDRGSGRKKPARKSAKPADPQKPPADPS